MDGERTNERHIAQWWWISTARDYATFDRNDDLLAGYRLTEDSR